MVEVEVIGISLVPDRKMGSVVLLKETKGERILPIFIGIPEARAISLVRKNLKLHRPLTHDLMHNLLKAFKVNLERLDITDLRDGIFYGRLILRKPGEKSTREIDCRPSDGLVLALKSDASILVDDEVFDEAYQPELEIPEMQPEVKKEREAEPVKGQSGLEVLQRQIDEAIKREDYEEAARIRDRIKILEKGIGIDDKN